MGRSKKAFIEATSTAPRYTEADLPKGQLVGKLSQEDLDAALANGELGGEFQVTHTEIQSLGPRSAEDVAKFNAEEAPKYAKKYGGTYEMKPSGNLHRTWKSAPDWKRAGFNSPEEHAKELHALYTEDLLKEQAERKSTLDRMNAEPPKPPTERPNLDPSVGLPRAEEGSMAREHIDAMLKRQNESGSPETKEKPSSLLVWSQKKVDGENRHFVRLATKEERDARNSPAAPPPSEDERRAKEKADWEEKIKLAQGRLDESVSWLDTHAVKSEKIDNKGRKYTEYRPHSKDAFREHVKKHPDAFPGHENLSEAEFGLKYDEYRKLREYHRQTRENMLGALPNLRSKVWDKPYTFEQKGIEAASVLGPGETDRNKNPERRVSLEALEKLGAHAIENQDEQAATNFWKYIYSRESGHQGVIPLKSSDKRSTKMEDAPVTITGPCENELCLTQVSEEHGNVCKSCGEQGISNPRIKRDERTLADAAKLDRERVERVRGATIGSTPESEEEKANIAEQEAPRKARKARKAAIGAVNALNKSRGTGKQVLPEDLAGPSKEDLEEAEEEAPTKKDFEEIDEYANSSEDEERKS